MSIAETTTAETTQHEVASHAGAEFFCDNLMRLDPATAMPGSKVLIAGCGEGHEAALIQRLLAAQVEAVDVEHFLLDKFSAWPNLNFQTSSVCDLPFDTGHFDAIFYHHVIEHVDNPVQSLVELSRVLKPNGWMFVGTPNRHRIVSSVGAHKQSTWEPTWQNKLNDNINDWTARLKGRFRNEFGAHAGFSRRELTGLLKANFGKQEWVTKQYLKYKYTDHRFATAVNLIATPPLQNFGAPSIYVYAQNQA